MTVYLLVKHPSVYKYGPRREYLKACEVVAVYAERKEPSDIAAKKNARSAYYFYEVQRKTVKE